jgi:integral membrane sensor domain MASE1
VGPAILFALSNTLAAIAGALVFRWLRCDTSLERIRDVIAVMAVAVPLSGIPSALFATAALYTADIPLSNPLATTGFLWWDGHFMSGLLVGPLAICWGGQWGKPLRHQRPVELAVLTVVVGVVTSWPIISYASQLGIITTTFALVVLDL